MDFCFSLDLPELFDVAAGAPTGGVASESNGYILFCRGDTLETAHVIQTQLGWFVWVPDIPQLHRSPDTVPGIQMHVLHWDLLC